MATQTVERISIDLKLADAKKENLRKAYEHLQAHSSSIASLTLQWKDLEAHFDSIKISIEQRFKELELREKGLQDKIRELESKEEQLASLTISKVKTEPIDYDSPSKSANLRFSVKLDGKALQDFLNEHEGDHELMRDEVFKALRFSSDPARLVLDAMVGFYENEEGEKERDISAVRKSCLLLLEQLSKVGQEISEKVKKGAMKLAMEWKGKMRIDNELEVLGFLQLLVSYGLVTSFSADDVLNALVSVAGDKRAAALCHDLVTCFCVDDVLNALVSLSGDKRAATLCRELGLVDKISDHIQECINKKKRLEAVKLVHAFELVDRFPPAALLKNHYMDIKKAAKYACRGKKVTRDVQIEYIDKQIEAAKAVIERIKKYNLGSEYPPEGLEMHVRELENRRITQRNAEQASVTCGHPQEQSGGKAAPLQGAQSVEQIVNKHGTNLTVKSECKESSDEQCLQNRLIEPKIKRQSSSLMISEPEQQIVHKRLRTNPPVMASTNASVVAATPVDSTQQSHRPPTGFYLSQGAPFLSPPAGQFNMGDLRPIPACMNPLAVAYCVTGSVPVGSQTNTSSGPYGPGIAPKAPVASHYMPVAHGNTDHYYCSNVASNGNIEQDGPGVAPRACTGELVPKTNTPLSVNNGQFRVAGMYAFPPTNNGTARTNTTVVPSTNSKFSAPSYPAHQSPAPYGHCYGLPPQQRPPHQQPDYHI